MKQVFCPNCGRECFGFWKYPPHAACSLVCFRQLIAVGKIPKLSPYTENIELGISAPRNSNDDS